MRSLVAFTVTACIGLTGCSDPEASPGGPATPREAKNTSANTDSNPSVDPERCGRDRAAPSLETPDAATVARTPWRLVLIGSCRAPNDDSGKPDSFFMDGWAGLPADCNGQSARYQANGRQFIVDPNDVGTTLAMCSPQGPSGYLGSVTSWGIATNGNLYLLDDEDVTVFAVEPTSAPGCIISIPPNGREIVSAGDPACTPEGTDLEDDQWG